MNLVESETLEFKEVGHHFIVEFKRKVIKTVEKIMNAIKENPRITQQELIEVTGLTRRGVEWNIKKLKDQGALKRIGSKKDGYWVIIDKNGDKES